MIWEVAVWVIWRARNEGIFNNGIARWDELVEEVMVLSLRWLLERFTRHVCFMSDVGVLGFSC